MSQIQKIQYFWRPIPTQ